MIFSYNWLQDYIKERLPKPQKLAEFLTMHSFEVSELKKSGKDWILDIDVLPNRGPDCFSHLGIARECSALLNLKLKTQNSKLQFKIQNLKAKDFVLVEVKDKNACPRYIARVITDVKVKPSPKWIQERLKVCGLRPINNVVDIVNYVMLEVGQPLHAFDFDRLSPTNYESKRITNKKIIVRKAKKGEKITTLDNERYGLDGNILVIADEKEPIAIAGIKGGKKAEIDRKTKTIILESANFDKLVIRKGSRKLNLKTDASLRFEHGLDPNLAELAINRTAYLIQKIAGGKIYQGLVDIYPQKILPKIIKLDLDYLEKLIGVKIPQREVRNILERIGLKIKNLKLKIIEVEVPTFRLDISLPEDLIEEIGRIYSYEKIASVFPTGVLIPPKRNLEIFWENFVKDILKEAGFSEVYNYSFVSSQQISDFQFSTPNLIELKNPISSDFQYLRPSLIPNLLKNVGRNQKNFREIKIFELGKTFKKCQMSNVKCQMFEKRMLTALMTGEKFYEIKGAVDLLLNKLGISNVWYDEYQPTPEQSEIFLWHSKKCAEIKVDNEEIGFLGEISPRILDNFKIENKVVVFDIDFEKLIKLASEEQEYRPISKYPAAIRDLAVLVPREIRVEEVLNKIETAGGILLKDIDLFDIYEGEELPEGKKNLAFHLIYQAGDHTLISGEIDKIQNKIIKVLEENPEWQVRR